MHPPRAITPPDGLASWAILRLHRHFDWIAAWRHAPAKNEVSVCAKVAWLLMRQLEDFAQQ
jgi:hypothetical protein